jgi:hypothetical protein
MAFLKALLPGLIEEIYEKPATNASSSGWRFKLET